MDKQTAIRLLELPDAQIAARLRDEMDTDGSDLATSILVNNLMDDPNQRPRMIRIYELVLDQVSDPVALVQILWKMVYAARNQVGLWPTCGIHNIIDYGMSIVRELPPGQERQSLAAMGHYHRALVHREVYEPGHFQLAAACHREVGLCETDPGRKQVAWFFVAVEMAHHAIETNKDIPEALTNLRHEWAELRAFRDSDNGYVRKVSRAEANHVLYLHYLGGEWGYEGRASDLETLTTMEPGRLIQYNHWVKGIQAVEIMQRNRSHLTLAAQLTDDVMKEQAYPAGTCFVMIVRADIAFQDKQPGLGVALLIAVVTYPSHGAHMMRAHAKGKLRRLRDNGIAIPPNVLE